MTAALALFGGPKAVTRQAAAYRSIGKEEAAAAASVVESGNLSQFLGCWEPDFFGGPRIQAFEKAWSDYYGVKHTVSVNSNTSGLVAALGAVGVEPGDEVIVPPWTMSATAASILVWNAIPVFVDIEPRTFCLDPKDLERKITPRTKAVMAVDIFGHGAEMDAVLALARKHGLKVISDCAQAPGAFDNGRRVGTLSDIGVFSLNYHKHIHTGEGGMCVTNDPRLAERLQLIRNHAESVVAGKGVADISNMIGFNFRMTEIEAAIGTEQLKKLAGAVAQRAHAADRLSAGLAGLPGLRTPVVRPGCTHVYYVYPLVFDASVAGVPRRRVAEALRAEGVDINEGYVNAHLLPIFQQKIAYGRGGFPWSAFPHGKDVSYAKGICPVAERMNDSDFLGIEMCRFRYDDADIDLIVQAFRKVWDALPQLKA